VTFAVVASAKLAGSAMELLLNLVWIALAFGAFGAFGALARMQLISTEKDCLPGARNAKALLALSCVLVLLFPIVSASDDLHPSQAVLEDATKRIQQGIVSLEFPVGHVSGALVPEVFVASAWRGLSQLGRLQPATVPARVLWRGHRFVDGRSPPSA
jgi:hypothetical protein